MERNAPVNTEWTLSSQHVGPSSFAQCDAARAKETFHTTAIQAAELAREAEVKQLIIGHFSARYEDENILLEEAKTIYPNTLLAKENLRISIN